LKDPNQIQNLAINLKAAMERLNVSQEQLEAESGVSQSVISRILNAKMQPGVTTVWRLATALNTSMDWLLATPRERILAKSG